MKVLLSLIITCMLCSSVQAQNYAIVGATVHTMGPKGTLENATVLIQNDKIQAVLTGHSDLQGYKVINAQGKVITPGLIGAHTSLGLVEVSSSAGTVDSDVLPVNFSTVGAAVDVSFGINPDSSLMNISRIAGVTSAASSVTRSEQLFSGQGAMITLGDKTQAIIKPRAYMGVNMSNGGADNIGGSRALLWVALEQAISETEFVGSKGLSPAQQWHGELARADLRALWPVVNGDIPLIIDARRAADIRQVIAFKKRHPKLHIVLLEATEGWRVADELAANNIAVILDPESNLPYAFDQLGATLANAARLDKAGVMVVIGMGSHNIRLAKQHAGNAVANGLAWQRGLAALTINPATIYQIDALVGSLEAGKQADLVIWSGDPLEVTETAEQVFIEGQLLDMQSRQTKLRDRYLDLQQDRPMRYVRP
jgi:imidazolonepropionase-like amidohydrolase